MGDGTVHTYSGVAIKDRTRCDTKPTQCECEDGQTFTPRGKRKKQKKESKKESKAGMPCGGKALIATCTCRQGKKVSGLNCTGRRGKRAPPLSCSCTDGTTWENSRAKDKQDKRDKRKNKKEKK